MRDWWLGTKENEWVSMSVISDGSYGAPKDVIFSFPVQIKDGKWSIVQGLELDEWAKSKFSITSKELEEERIAAGLGE
nr:cytosolic malate dehydrogenase [Schistosoma japonicum]